MSQVHRVIILNRPMKIRGYTPFQWILMVASAAGAFAVLSWFPKEWKVQNLPVGFLVGLCVFCVALVFIHASQLKTFIWWRNVIFYALGVLPRVFLPHSEPSVTYLEPDKVEEKKSRTHIAFEK